MIGLSELTNLIWNENGLPNDIKKNWVTICNSRYMMTPSKHIWTGVDSLNLIDSRLTSLLNDIKQFNFSWIAVMELYLLEWKDQNDTIIKEIIQYKN